MKEGHKSWYEFHRYGRVIIVGVGPVESHGGAQGNILMGPSNIFTGRLWREKFWIFLFKMVHSGVLYISGRWRGPPHCGARGS